MKLMTEQELKDYLSVLSPRDLKSVDRLSYDPLKSLEALEEMAANNRDHAMQQRVRAALSLRSHRANWGVYPT